MAENSVIISSEEEAKLLKPIDEYVEEAIWPRITKRIITT